MDLLHEKIAKYTQPAEVRAKGLYPYFRAIEGKQGTGVSHVYLLIF